MQPGRILTLALIYLIGCTWLAVSLATHTPWLGLRLTADGSTLRVAEASGPAAQVPIGARLLGVASVSAPGMMSLAAQDIVEEPDMVRTYEELDLYLKRQGQIAQVLDAHEVRLQLQHQAQTADAAFEITVQPGRRPISDLPLPFWFVVAVAWLAVLVSWGIWAMRPRDWATRMFALTGMLLPLAALPTVIYGSRELALGAELFGLLKVFNHQGSALWGAAFVGIFMAYPTPIGSTRLLWLPQLVFGIWSLADLMRWLPDLDVGIRGLLMTELMAALALGIWQWRRSTSAPVARAALRWFLLSMLLGSSLFIVTVILSVTLGGLPPLPQAYAFGFFLLIYLGIALGLGRYRLFDLDVWAYRLLVWMGAAGLVMAIDVGLVALLEWSEGLALGSALWAASLLYLPLRGWLWRRMVQRPSRKLEELWPDLVRMAFLEDLTQREQWWAATLNRLFRPADQRVVPEPPGLANATGLRDDGLGLWVPACAGLNGRELRLAHLGQRLFTPDDVRFMSALCELMARAHASQRAHAEGAAAERRRITQDIHDDVGARLLMLIHRAPTEELAELARSAMNDLRSAIAALEARPISLHDAVADWRSEASHRCEAAQVQLTWRSELPPDQLKTFDWRPRQRLLLERALRECLTNSLKHAEPKAMWVSIELVAGEVCIDIANDQQTSHGWPWVEGRGLQGMRQRLQADQGHLDVHPRQGGGAVVRIRLRPSASVPS